MKIEDLDIVRPASKFIRLGGKDLDVSFVPCGITFEVDAVIQELGKIDQSKLQTSPEETRNAFNLSIKLCALFCSHKYPHMDIDWFQSNTDALQIQLFSTAIREALIRSYSGVDTAKKE